MTQLDLPLRHRAPASVELVDCDAYHCRLTLSACIGRQPQTERSQKQIRKTLHQSGRPATMCESGRCWQGACRLADAGIWRWERCCSHGCARCRGTGRVPMPRE